VVESSGGHARFLLCVALEFSRAGTRSFFNNSAALMWIAEGITSLLDWPMLT